MSSGTDFSHRQYEQTVHYRFRRTLMRLGLMNYLVDDREIEFTLGMGI